MIYYLPRQDEEQNGDAQVRCGHVDPDVQGERRQEGKQIRRLLYGLGEQYADAQRHEGHREVDRSPALIGNGEVANGQIGFLKSKS